MLNLSQFEVWFVTGSQHLYGYETLRQVAEHSQQIARYLDEAPEIPVRVVFKPVLTTPDEIYRLCQAANAAEHCVGIITWMHTFSPAKMWIGGLNVLQKPLLHLHTQFNRDIPWGEIDMDFMNLNQSAHGDREFGFLMARMRRSRKVVVGHWQHRDVLDQIEVWARVAAARHDLQGAAFVRFGDNMRYVAVTDGNKVSAEITFGYSVNTHGVGDLVRVIDQMSDAAVEALCAEYADTYQMAPELLPTGDRHASLREAARIELGLRAFLEDGNYKGFTNTFEDLHGLSQLPGIATQRLMAAGYGFGAEGDWKTAALLRAMKVMASGLPDGNSFMEDYTYHLAEPLDRGTRDRFRNQWVLGAHMLEICPTIAAQKPICCVHPLGIGGKDDPVRLVFSTFAGPGLNASLIDLGNRFRLLVNEVEAVVPPHDLPKLPVARVLWKPQPDLPTACAAWILAGGAHHTVFSQNLTTEYLEDFADMAGIELAVIDRDTRLRTFKNELRWNEVAYR
ncbi:L-arabinose isomerase [Rhabdobacter roseus]|uniref:L-arabinose isomerase n=1 Tax=Rhabdobacter roseus TaxID=1655419 RepID=A0A840TMV6_9BACT|nr:L-arabinose isomerase [Rhabdobacter roseus]MBB5282872.1 L-arabinose isomerase [Rhabdobacter roseus]